MTWMWTREAGVRGRSAYAGSQLELDPGEEVDLVRTRGNGGRAANYHHLLPPPFLLCSLLPWIGISEWDWGNWSTRSYPVGGHPRRWMISIVEEELGGTQ